MLNTFINICFSVAANRKFENFHKQLNFNSSRMIEGQALNNSEENCSQSYFESGPSATDIGRTLARIGDNLNEETSTRRSVIRPTIVLFLQLGDLWGVSMSFFRIPFNGVPFHREAEVSLLIFILRFHAGMSFIHVRDG